jgi:hypothetical protein
MEGKMSLKAILLGTLLVTLLLTGYLFSYRTTPQDLPSGVAAHDWIQLTENSGIALTRNKRFLGSPDDLHGILYVKAENGWHRFHFDPAPISIMPAR